MFVYLSILCRKNVFSWTRAEQLPSMLWWGESLFQRFRLKKIEMPISSRKMSVFGYKAFLITGCSKSELVTHKGIYLIWLWPSFVNWVRDWMISGISVPRVMTVVKKHFAPNDTYVEYRDAWFWIAGPLKDKWTVSSLCLLCELFCHLSRCITVLMKKLTELKFVCTILDIAYFAP